MPRALVAFARTLAITCAALLPATLLAEQTEDGGERHGMDVLGAAGTVKKWLDTGKEAPADKPWAKDLADITDTNQGVAARAIRNLVVAGGRHPEVLTDLAVLATDRDWQLRSRVVRVCSGIGGSPATPLTLQLSRDRDWRVRELATLALAHCVGDEAFARLLELLASPESQLRQAAASSLGAFGDLRGLEPLTHQELEGDDLVKREMRNALTRLARSSDGVTAVVALAAQVRDVRRDALLEAVIDLADRRLCPVLTAVAADPGQGGRAIEASALTQFMAVRGLRSSGDYRAVAVLVGLADSEATVEVRSGAADTLRLITGYGAAPGKAWRVWLADNQERVTRLAARDALLATLHDPRAAIDRAALAAWTIDDLGVLVDAVLEQPAGRVAPWWPARALEVLRADDRARWTGPLAARIVALPSNQPDARLGLLVLLDDLAGKAETAPFQLIADDLAKRLPLETDKAKELNARAPDHEAEIGLLGDALTRRGGKLRL